VTSAAVAVADSTNSTAGLQVAGAVGLRACLGSGVTNGATLYSFDDFRVTSIPS
jgi:hypothetical protein